MHSRLDLLTAQSLSAWISDLAVPDSSGAAAFADGFVEPNGELHRQGVVTATLALDTATFQRLYRQAIALGYHPITDYEGAYNLQAMVGSSTGVYRLQGKLPTDFRLSFLNPETQTLSVWYVITSGLP